MGAETSGTRRITYDKYDKYDKGEGGKGGGGGEEGGVEDEKKRVSGYNL